MNRRKAPMRKGWRMEREQVMHLMQKFHAYLHCTQVSLFNVSSLLPVGGNGTLKRKRTFYKLHEKQSAYAMLLERTSAGVLS
jgi:hypothetical protein